MVDPYEHHGRLVLVILVGKRNLHQLDKNGSIAELSNAKV